MASSRSLGGGGGETRPPQSSSKSPSVTGGSMRSISSTGASSLTTAPSGMEASSVTLLLANWKNFGLAERVCYHFDLIETLTSVPQQQPQSHVPDSPLPDARPVSESTFTAQLEEAKDCYDCVHICNGGEPIRLREPTCGVVSLLECVPDVSTSRLSKRNRNALRNRHRDFNRLAHLQSQQTDSHAGVCVQPTSLPLKLSPSTRVTCAYQMTRVAFCLDASPTLTCTFGNLHSNDDDDDPSLCCPMDRLDGMVRKYFSALMEPISAPSVLADGSTVWNPLVAVTVLAVYPKHLGTSDSTSSRSSTSILVRDFRIHNEETALILAQKIAQWATLVVEEQISQRLTNSHSAPSRTTAYNSGSSYDPWTAASASSLKDLLEAGDVALSTLPAEGRPCIVIATDCRSVYCESIIDIISDANRLDAPLHILDLSSPTSHVSELPSFGGSSHYHNSIPRQHTNLDLVSSNQPNYLTLEDIGPSTFPLNLPDDSVALHGICKAVNGCFWDEALLDAAIGTYAGQVPPDSPLQVDSFFTIRRRSLRVNGVQWYTLFSLSPLSPISNATSGKLPAPRYIRIRHEITSGNYHSGKVVLDSSGGTKNYSSIPTTGTNRTTANSENSGNILVGVHTPSFGGLHDNRISAAPRTFFSSYTLNPVRIKGLLLMRIMEGYRARRYGSNTHDIDKVSVHFTLPLESATTLHYEISFTASPYHDPRVGTAKVKIELSGDLAFVQSVKDDFMAHQVGTQRQRTSTIGQQTSARLGKFLRWMRKEDHFESYLCPLEWGNKLMAGSNFLTRLGRLSRYERQRHFRNEVFDVVCTGGKVHGDEGLLSEFLTLDYGETDLYDTLAHWATETIVKDKRYVKRLDGLGDNLTGYCVATVAQSHMAEHLFTISIDFFEAINASDRIAVVLSLKNSIEECKDTVVLPKVLSDQLVVPRSRRRHEADTLEARKHKLISDYYFHETYDLVKDVELLPLLVKRRTEIGNFWLLHSDSSSVTPHAMFAKFMVDDAPSDDSSEQPSPTNLQLLQYQVNTQHDDVTVDIHKDIPRGVFSPLRKRRVGRSKGASDSSNDFHGRCKRRDQECSQVLRTRTSLLHVFEKDNDPCLDNNMVQVESHTDSVTRLLAYASSVVVKLRFFHPGCGPANDVLEKLVTSLMLSGSFQYRVAQLSIDSNAIIGDKQGGIWFVVHYDRFTISMIHFALTEKERINEDGRREMYRELTFFTVGSGDLYSTRGEDDDNDDESNSHVSEYMCVSEFVDSIETLHGYSYARAVYLALQNEKENALHVKSFHPDDFAYALQFCDYVNIAHVLVSREAKSIEEEKNLGGDSQLSKILDSILTPVPGDAEHFYWHVDADEAFGEEAQDSPRLQFENMISEGLASFSDVNDESATQSDSHTDTDLESFEATISIDSEPTETTDKDRASPQIIPPLFVKFILDGKVITKEDFAKIDKSSALTACATIFQQDFSAKEEYVGNKQALPEVHNALSLKLQSRLDAYVAEQTLERLRHQGESISQIDLQAAMKCLMKADNVISATVPVYFFLPRLDLLATASAPTGSERDIDNGFLLLNREILLQNTIKMRKCGHAFFAAETESRDSPLPFWCFAMIERAFGFVSIYVHHPLGEGAARDICELISNTVHQTCHRVNQLVLLDSLHTTRTASRYLLIDEEQNDKKEYNISLDEDQSTEKYTYAPPGHFGCPIKFRFFFSLYHRCAPSQVIVALEASVLHNFAVSNRRGIFVYKDETGFIFYMKLESHDDKIELLVFGVNRPGPSITDQLKRLLQKKIASISVDTISSLLTKNPHFNLLPTDLSFIHSFEAMWQQLEDGDVPSSDSSVRLYEFPPHVHDPFLVLVYFLQNILGSGFFHRLREADSEDNEPDADLKEVTEWRDVNFTTGINVPFEPREFSMFYNNAPSPLDPKEQAVSTLTKQGTIYSETTGTGIALIEISLVHKDGSPVQTLNIGALPGQQEDPYPVPKLGITFKRIEDVYQSINKSDKHSYCVQVRLVNTTLKQTVLQDWIELTLNQVMTAWSFERHLERSRNGMLLLSPHFRSHSNFELEDREKALDSFCRGLPSLIRMAKIASDLPHPGFEMVSIGEPVRATILAKLTLDILERAILNLMFNEKKVNLDDCPDMVILRLCKGQEQRVVHLSRDSSRKGVCLVDKNSGSIKALKDTPLSSPEYVCIFGFGKEFSDDMRPGHIDTQPKTRFRPPASAHLFANLVVGRTTNGSKSKIIHDSIMRLMKQSPSVFRRSMLFVLSVSRTSRDLLSYNFNPQLVKIMAKRMKEVEEAALHMEVKHMKVQQSRCIGAFSALGMLKESKDSVSRNNILSGEKASSAKEVLLIKQDNSVKENDSVDTLPPIPSNAPPRKIRRPTFIRRPKLIGKSVEGAAMQAMAASRARASTGIKPVQAVGLPAPSRGHREKVQPNSSSATTNRAGVNRDRTLTVTSKDSTRGQTDSMSELRVTREIDQEKRQKSMLTAETLPKYYQQVVKNILSFRDLSCHLNHHAVQAQVNPWIYLARQNIVHPHFMDLILSYGCCIRSDSVKLLQHCIGKEDLFPTYVSTNIPGLVQIRTSSQVETHRRQSQLKASNQPIYFLKESNECKACKLYIIMKVFIFKSKLDSTYMSTFEIWMMNGLKDRQSKTSGLKSARKHKRIKRETIARSERRASNLGTAVANFVHTINIENEVFNFSCLLLLESCGVDRSDHISVISLLHEIYERFPLSRQQRMMKSQKYRLITWSLPLAEIRSRYVCFCTASTLFRYLCSNVHTSGMIVCNCGRLGNCLVATSCLGGTMPVTMFITLSANDSSAFDIYALCTTGGRNLDDFDVTDAKTNFVYTFSDKLIMETEIALQQNACVAALNLRRDNLWSKFAEHTQDSARGAVPLKIALTPEELDEMCHLSNSTPLVSNDPHLQMLLSDDTDQHLPLHWSTVLSSMNNDPVFRHSLSFQSPTEDGVVRYLHYFPLEDMFLSFDLDCRSDMLSQSRILTRGMNSNDDQKSKVSETFANYILHFIWQNL